MTFSAPVLEVQQADADSKAIEARSGFSRYRGAMLVAFILSVAAVGIPGRLDGTLGYEDWPEEGVAFATPALYAFAIWGAIYLTEFIFVGWLACRVKADSAPLRQIQMLRAFAPGWCAGNIFAALWCLTFRTYLFSAAWFWIPAVFLSGSAIGLSFAHRAAVAAAEGAELFLVVTPITLHCGWVTAAALLNWNQWVTLLSTSNTVRLTALGISLVVAAGAGIGLSALRRAPGYACTVAWAVIALGVQTLGSEGMAAELGEDNALALAAVELVVGGGLAAYGVGFKALLVMRR